MNLLLFELVSFVAAARHEGVPAGACSARSAACLLTNYLCGKACLAACSRATLFVTLCTPGCWHSRDLLSLSGRAA